MRLGARICIALFLVAFAARFGATLVAGLGTVRFGDARAYLYAAGEIARTGHYPLATERLYFRAPGYPYFLVAATLGSPTRIPLAKMANAVLGGLSALLLAAISARIFRRREIAIATGFAAALHPAFVYTATDIQSEPLFLLLLLCSGFLLLAAADRPSTSLALGAGVFLALAALTRPSALAIAPLLLAPSLDRRYPPRARVHLVGAALAGLLITLLPWTLRNAIVFREFLPVNDIAGSAFYQGNSHWTIRFYEVRSKAEYLEWVRGMFGDMERFAADLETQGKASRSARSRAFFERALAERRADPAGWARLVLRKAWDWLRPYPTPWFWPKAIVAGIGFYYAALFCLAAAGLFRAPRPGVRAFAICLLVLTMAVHVAIVVVWRYRVPYWDPVLLLYGVFGAGITLAPLWKSRAP